MWSNSQSKIVLLSAMVSLCMLLSACSDSVKSASQGFKQHDKSQDNNPALPATPNTPPQPPSIGISAFEVSSSSVEVGATLTLTLIGRSLPTDKMLTVNGCDAQAKVSLAVDEHTYTCTVPTAVTDKHTLSVMSRDGKTKLFSRDIKITSTPSTTKLTATGITLCGDDNSNSVVCSLLTSNWKGLLQDGEVQAGQKMSYGLRTHSGDTCVIDKVTGLTWEQKTADNKDDTYTWDNAKNHINALNAKSYCGYSDWRPPNVDELMSIVDYSKVDPAINTSYFPYTENSWYRSSSPDANDSNDAWLVDFGYFFNGGVYNGNKGYYNRVRAVRSGS